MRYELSSAKWFVATKADNRVFLVNVASVRKS